jgi:hypothetical protein
MRRDELTPEVLEAIAFQAMANGITELFTMLAKECRDSQKVGSAIARSLMKQAAMIMTAGICPEDSTATEQEPVYKAAAKAAYASAYRIIKESQ